MAEGGFAIQHSAGDIVEYNQIYRLYFGLFNTIKKDSKISPKAIGNAENDISKAFIENNIRAIDFNEPRYQCAFVRKYSSLVACLTRKATSIFLEKAPKEITNKLFEKRKLRIAFIGGEKIDGMLGTCSALGNDLRHDLLKPIKCYIIESRPGWENLIEKSFDMLLNGDFGINSIVVSADEYSQRRSLQRTELTEEQINNVLSEENNEFESEALKKIQRADLVIAAKSLSILDPEHATNLLKVIFSNMKEKAIFLAVDFGLNDLNIKRVSEQEGNDMELIYELKLTKFALPLERITQREQIVNLKLNTDQFFEIYAARKMEPKEIADKVEKMDLEKKGRKVKKK